MKTRERRVKTTVATCMRLLQFVSKQKSRFPHCMYSS